MTIEYKCVGAPEKGRRKKGAKTRSDRVAVAMQELIQAEAVDGWAYLRTDLVPVEERSGLLGRSHEVHRAVLVFQRNRAAEAAQPAARPVAEPSLAPSPAGQPEEPPIKLAAGEAPGSAAHEPVQTPKGLG